MTSVIEYGNAAAGRRLKLSYMHGYGASEIGELENHSLGACQP